MIPEHQVRAVADLIGVGVATLRLEPLAVPAADRVDDCSAVVYRLPAELASRFRNWAGDRLTPPRSSFWKFELPSQRHASDDRFGWELVKTSGSAADEIEIGAIVDLLEVAVDALEVAVRERVVATRKPY